MTAPPGLLLLASSEADAAFLREQVPLSPLDGRLVASLESCRDALRDRSWIGALCDARRLPLPPAIELLTSGTEPLPTFLVADALTPELAALALRIGASIHVARGDPGALRDALRNAARIAEARHTRRQHEQFDAGQRAVLEQIGAGAPLSELLEMIVCLVEAQADGLACSLLIVDAAAGRVRHGAAPSLPEEYNLAIDGATIGPDEGSCGAAAYRGERVIVEDIDTHPNWAAYKHLALAHGLRACWSTPIFSPSGTVLGTFAIYHRERHTPTASEMHWVDTATHLASLAIQRERNEQALRASESRFRQLVATTHEGVWVLDREGRTTFANRRMAEMIRTTPEEMLGRSVYDLLLPADRTSVEARLSRLEHGASEQSEVRIATKDGSELWAIVASSPIVDDAGAYAGSLGMVTDMTEYRRAVSERLSREGVLRVLFDNVSDVVFYLDVASGPPRRFQFRSVNPEFLRATGLEPEQIVGRFVDEVVPEPSRSVVVANYERAIEERRTVRWDEVTPYPAGLKHGEVAVTPVFDQSGSCTSIVGTVHDITDRITAQERISSQARILDRANDAIIVRGLDDGVVEYWNQGAAKLYGYTSEEAVGQRIRDLIYRQPAEMLAAQRKLLQEGVWSGELTQHAKGGRTLTVRASWTLQRDSPGRPPRMLAINTDVTETKKLQARVAQSQRMESLGTLAGGIAHDFNNLLTAIIGNVELALRQVPEGSPLRERLEIVRRASGRATDLVSQILTFSRRRQPRRTLVDMSTIVDETVTLMKTTLPERIAVSARRPDARLPVVADPSQLHQVIMNLGTNAAQAIGSGSGSLDFGLDVVTVDRTVEGELPAGSYVRLTVSDTGTGMDEATLARIFEPFFTTKGPGGGTGLGLSVVHGIVTGHEGTIRVENRAGGGTTFTVHLPVAEQGSAAEARAAGPPQLPYRGRGESLLYVDDQEAVVSIVCGTLEGTGYRCMGFTDPARALAAFREEPARFDVVIADAGMESMAALEIVDAVRRVRDGVPVIVVSGYLPPHEHVALRKAGVSAILAKPGFVDELPRTLRRILASP